MADGPRSGRRTEIVLTGLAVVIGLVDAVLLTSLVVVGTGEGPSLVVLGAWALGSAGAIALLKEAQLRGWDAAVVLLALPLPVLLPFVSFMVIA